MMEILKYFLNMENEGKNGGEKVFCEIWKWIFVRKGVKVIGDTFAMIGGNYG